MDALQRRCDRLLELPDRRAVLTARGHERVRRQFDAQRTARRIARLLQTLVVWNGRRRPATPVRDPAPSPG